MVANRRGVSALSEHRRQEGWTFTPCTCSSSSDSGDYDEMAGERLPKQRPHLSEETKDEEEVCLTAKKGEELPDRKTAENPGARLLHLDEEAGSDVFHFSSNMNDMRNDNIEPRATASTAATEANRTLGEAEVASLSEHRRLDGWTSTPCTCGSSGCSGGCDVPAGERLPKQRPHLFEGKKRGRNTSDNNKGR